MKEFKVVYSINGNDADMLVHAHSLSEAKRTAYMLLNGKNASIIGVVEAKTVTEQKNILLCEQNG